MGKPESTAQVNSKVHRVRFDTHPNALDMYSTPYAGFSVQ